MCLVHCVASPSSALLADADLDRWREAAENRPENAEGFAILDKYGGFDLLKGCLKLDPNQRISAASAAASGFCRA